MTVPDASIDDFLKPIRAEGRSSPAGTYWHEFYEFLQARAKPGQTWPKAPLILAASGESNRAKHDRLRVQLEWANEAGCLEEAIGYLQGIPADRWNSGNLECWDKDSY